ncbi:ribosomal protein S5 domain 2-like protein [Hysterangium stoloniferum]|nr:ribosomal protein S5 domain 2-like protein [Hysterangium stoloniferum]
MASFDRRRINGPEESRPPVFEDDEDAEQISVTPKTRKGRANKDIRPIFLTTGLISQANGSSYIETEKTKIACAIRSATNKKMHPITRYGKLNVEVKFSPFSCSRRRAPLRDAEDRSISVLIQQSLLPSLRLELLPKSGIDVFITIIENDGVEACVASGAVAASTALADAGIEMFDLVTSCASVCAMVEEEMLVDPTAEETVRARASFTIACIPALGTVTNILQTGQLTAQEAICCWEVCQTYCRDIHNVMASALLNSQAAKCS